MKVLLTGFEPFGGALVNPAYEAVKMLPDELAGNKLIKKEIPTVFGRDEKVLRELVKECLPDVVICVGQAGGRSGITVEKVAVNLMEASIPDNDGNQPFDQPVKEDGETAYFAKLPVKKIVQNMKNHKIPARISYTAGTYVCNDIMYRLLYMIDREYPQMQGGFIHVPYCPEQVIELSDGVPSMSLEMIADALKCAIMAVCEDGDEIDVAMGEIG